MTFIIRYHLHATAPSTTPETRDVVIEGTDLHEVGAAQLALAALRSDPSAIANERQAPLTGLNRNITGADEYVTILSETQRCSATVGQLSASLRNRQFRIPANWCTAEQTTFDVAVPPFTARITSVGEHHRLVLVQPDLNTANSPVTTAIARFTRIDGTPLTEEFHGNIILTGDSGTPRTIHAQVYLGPQNQYELRIHRDLPPGAYSGSIALTSASSGRISGSFNFSFPYPSLQINSVTVLPSRVDVLMIEVDATAPDAATINFQGPNGSSAFDTINILPGRHRYAIHLTGAALTARTAESGSATISFSNRTTYPLNIH